MNQVIRTFCEEKNIRFGQGYADGMEEFFAIDGNGIFLIYGRPIVGATQGEVVVRGDATRYLSELVARLDRNGNTVRVSGNTLSVVFKLRTPMGYGVPRRIPTPPTPSNNYLYFEAKQANSTVGMVSILPTAPNMEYSIDGGTTFQAWNSIQQEVGGGMMVWMFDTITLGAIGDKVYFRGVNAALSDIANNIFSLFSPTGNVKVGGSVQSLVDGTGESTTAIEMAMLFCDQMNSEAITEIEEGLLPATTLVPYCYMGMFSMYQENIILTTTPILPAKILVKYCYSTLFDQTAILKVTCLATDNSATGCTNGWLSSDGGVFYKNADMDIANWSRDYSGIPNSWTVQDYSE